MASPSGADSDLWTEFEGLNLVDSPLLAPPPPALPPAKQPGCSTVKAPIRHLLRVHKEVEDVNSDFHSLRTVLKETRNRNKWNFVMFPNDGALSHLPLIGELIIPEKYPEYPPVLHLFTATRRYNVDVYRSFIKRDDHSTMCFDILRNKANGGTWLPDYTISCLFASLMQALVSQRVPQEYGGERPEFVSMERLAGIKRDVKETYNSNKSRFPYLPSIPIIPATPVPTSPFTFTRLDQEDPLDSLEFRGEDIYVSQPMYLQDDQNKGAWSTHLDLRNLHPGVVFSVILSNRRGTDVFGKVKDTILLRNGVTGTAAKKRAYKPISWFYHGKPLNDRDLSICVTVTNDQFVIAYKDSDDGTDTFIVHGDTAISKLGEAEIGKVAGLPFYLTIYLKRKTGDNGFIDVLEHTGTGFVHDANSIVALQTKQTRKKYPASVKLVLGGEQTARLQGIIDFYELGQSFQVQKSFMSPAEYTLVTSQAYTNQEEYAKIIDEFYAPLRDKAVEMNVTAIIADGDCVALLIDSSPEKDSVAIQQFTQDRNFPVGMRLKNDTLDMSCVAELDGRVNRDHLEEWVDLEDVFIRLPQPIKVACELQFEFE